MSEYTTECHVLNSALLHIVTAAAVPTRTLISGPATERCGGSKCGREEGSGMCEAAAERERERAAAPQ
jgi:hypothetical protein